jgi:hypothetical protein
MKAEGFLNIDGDGDGDTREASAVDEDVIADGDG